MSETTSSAQMDQDAVASVSGVLQADASAYNASVVRSLDEIDPPSLGAGGVPGSGVFAVAYRKIIADTKLFIDDAFNGAIALSEGVGMAQRNVGTSDATTASMMDRTVSPSSGDVGPLP